MRALIECQRLQPLAPPEEEIGGPMSLRQAAGGGLLSAEVALMWCVVCTWLQVWLPNYQPFSPLPHCDFLHPSTALSTPARNVRQCCFARGVLNWHEHPPAGLRRSRRAPRGRKLHPQAVRAHKWRLRRLLSISKPWSSCCRRAPQRCCRQLPRMRRLVGSMPSPAVSCWPSSVPAWI